MIDFTKFHGMVLYDIELNGCLNGVFTNNSPQADGHISNEIVKKSDGVLNNLDGDYTCSYIEAGNVVVQATLHVALNTTRGTYSFIWRENSNNLQIIFSGIGFQMNPHQIAVYYQKP
jgi:hypothetical protein